MEGGTNNGLHCCILSSVLGCVAQYGGSQVGACNIAGTELRIPIAGPVLLPRGKELPTAVTAPIRCCGSHFGTATPTGAEQLRSGLSVCYRNEAESWGSCPWSLGAQSCKSWEVSLQDFSFPLTVGVWTGELFALRTHTLTCLDVWSLPRTGLCSLLEYLDLWGGRIQRMNWKHAFLTHWGCLASELGVVVRLVRETLDRDCMATGYNVGCIFQSVIPPVKWEA